MAAHSLPPYQQAVPRGDAAEPPWYAPSPRLLNQRDDDSPPPDYFAASPTDCPHWVDRRCRLTARPRHCCSCMDTRPESLDGRYPVYMDGYAELGSVVRWAHYCEACRTAEGRRHKCTSVKPRPPPGVSAYRASGSEHARAARQRVAQHNTEVAKEVSRKAMDADTPDWFTRETTGQRKARERLERKERKERKERGRALHEAAREAAEKKRDDAWEADQLQRLSRGEPVASVTVRRHFEALGPVEAVVTALTAVTAAEVRAARKLWEAAGAASDEDLREQQQWHAMASARAQEAEDAKEAEEARRQRAAEQRALVKQHSEYEAYGDGADVHRSVSRTISREYTSKRARAASSSTAPGGSGSSSWFTRLFRRQGAR